MRLKENSFDLLKWKDAANKELNPGPCRKLKLILENKSEA